MVFVESLCSKITLLGNSVSYVTVTVCYVLHTSLKL